MLAEYTVTGRKPDLYKRYMDNVAGVASGSEQDPGGDSGFAPLGS